MHRPYRLWRPAGQFFAPPGASLRVLDVGGSTSALLVAGLPPGDGLASYLRAAPANLPFPDASFDLVCSCNPAGLREMLRVSRDGLLLEFPFDSEIEALLAGAGCAVLSFGHVSLVSRRKTVADLQTLRISLQHRTLEEQVAEQLREIECLRAELEWVRGATATVQEVLVRDLSVAEDVAVQLDSLSRRVESTSSQVAGIVESRIWRTLRALGGLVLAVRRRLAPWSEELLLICDEPAAGDRSAKSGALVVRGSALAPSGIAGVGVQVDEGPVLPARIGLPRPDVAQAHPGVRDAARSGYCCDVDTTALADGVHVIRIRAVSRRGVEREIRVQTYVDHGKGFASDYERWIAEVEGPSNALVRLRFQECTRRPPISVLMPVFNTPRFALVRAIASVREQSYERWELCIADDCSESAEVEEVLRQEAERDPRIKLTRTERRGGISAASNAALALAEGEYVALLDHDDELSPDALLHVVEAINRRPEAGFIYSDEDKIDYDGRRYGPFFKPDWSPELLLGENYVCHLSVAPTALVRGVGGFRGEFDGSQDHDLVLRLTRETREIVHVPAVLYHWRGLEGSAALDGNAKPYAADAAKRAIEDHIRSAGIAGRVEPAAVRDRWRVRYAIPENSRAAILIPSGGKLHVLRRNLDTLVDKTDYRDYEISVIDNSREDEVRRFVEGWERNGRRARYLDLRSLPFNFSALNNEAARRSDAPLLLFLNDDTEVIAPDWLTAMVELGTRPEVGAVGAKLLYPDGRIQHAGIVMGLAGICAHAFKGLDARLPHYYDFPDLIRNVSAVTGACLLVRSSVFHEVGGFDEAQFAADYCDVDLCLRIGRKGYRVVYTPHALLYHHESLSRSLENRTPRPAEILAMRTRWKETIAADPFYSPNLARVGKGYSFRRKG